MPPDGSQYAEFPGKQRNPFAEGMEEQPYDSDPFASPHSEGYSTKIGGHYDAAIPGRGGTLLLLGIAGMAVAIVGLLPLASCMPVNVLALTLTIPAWLMSRHDLEGMHLGAIESADRGRTRAAHLLGIAGTALTLISVGVVILMILMSVGTPAMIEFREMFG